MNSALLLVILCLISLSACAVQESIQGGDPRITGLHHDLKVRLEPASQQLAAEDVVTLNAQGTISFALGGQFTVTRLSMDGKDLPVKPSEESKGVSTWRLELDGPTAQHTLRLSYHGQLQPLDTRLDHREVLGFIPAMADTQGTYLPASGYQPSWYPSFDANAFTYSVSLDLPAEQRGLVPGRLVKEDLQHGRYQAQFEFKQPAEGIDLLAGPYQIKEIMHDGLRLRTYFHPEIAALAGDYLNSISTYLDRYKNNIGPYPFSEFSIVSSPLPTGFGMPTLTYLGINVLRLPFIRTTSLGHEILHNWWGNGVYIDLTRGNWAEGLTTFMADYAYKEQEGPDDARAMRLQWLRDFASIPPGQDQPLHQFTSRSHNTSEIVGYHKSAYIFLMLRDWIGKQAFDQALRNFWKEKQFQTASWKDLQHAFEKSSGKNLDIFFEQWLNRSGAPVVSADKLKAQPNPGGAGAYLASFTLTQPTPAYTLRVPIQIKTANGSAEKILELNDTEQSYTVELNEQPLTLSIDPDLRLFRRITDAEMPPLLRQAMTDPATLTVVVGSDPLLHKTAAELAGKLLDTAPCITDGSTAPPSDPLLVIGTHDKTAAFLQKHQLPAAPAQFTDKGSARVWSAKQNNGKILVVISAANTEALQALIRPLPHYGKESYLVFEDSKVIERGVWPAEGKVWSFPGDGGN
ncbi:MAG TPA: M1 family aminopeptidase [Gammaproteobacteria bacterium]|nr:M1 family aminopeptidase [Gammaproteobacteria bacterium]